MGEGFRTIQLYFVIYYIIPILYIFVFGYSHLSYLKGNPDYLSGFVYIIFYVVVLYIWSRFPRIKLRSDDVALNFFIGKYTNFFLVGVYLLLSHNFYSQYGLNFRHSGVGMSNTPGGYVIIISVLQLYFNAFIIAQLARLAYSKSIQPMDTVVLVGVLICRWWSMTTSFDAIVLCVITLIILSNYGGYRLLFRSGAGLFSSFRTYSIVFFVCVAVYFVGTANKIGIERATEWFLNDSFYDLTYEAMKRLSIFLYSTAYHVTNSIGDVNLSVDVVGGTVQNFLRRIGQIVGVSIAQPDIQSAERMNAISIYIDPRDITGASPGLVASTLFIAPFPLGVIVSVTIIKWVMDKINDIFSKGVGLSLISLGFMVITIETFFDATTSIFNLLEYGPIQMFFIYLVWLNRRYIWTDTDRR